MIRDDLLQDFHCPQCGAAPHEKCETNDGQTRFEPHRDRWDSGYLFAVRTRLKKPLTTADPGLLHCSIGVKIAKPQLGLHPEPTRKQIQSDYTLRKHS
jgi:hypothetical protein